MESGGLPGKGRIPESIEKLSRRVPKKGRICVSTEKWSNPCEYQEKEDPYECQRTFLVSTEKGSNQCEYEKLQNPGEYREKVESVRESKNCSDEYRKSVQSV